MGAAALPLAIGGTALSAYGQYESGEASKAALSYQAQVAANNAQIARQNAAWDMEAGEAASNARGLKTRAQVGSTVAKMGAAGIATGVGSAAQVASGQRQVGLLDALTIRSNAARQSYADEVQATSDTAQSQLDTMEAQQAETGGELGAVGSLLSGASRWGKYA